MFLPLVVEVKSIGEDVVLAIGSWKRRLYFETAILLADWMDTCGREAKEWAGNSKRLLRGIGTLHDASNPNWINAGQPFTPNGVPRVVRDVLKKHEIEVKSDGGTVVITAGSAMATMPYEAALQISQWIRLKAKESKTRAGDTTRHWSKVVAEHEAANGPVTRG